MKVTKTAQCSVKCILMWLDEYGGVAGQSFVCNHWLFAAQGE